MDMIKKLKENVKPFYTMTKEMQKAMVCDFEKDDIEYCHGDGWIRKDKDGSMGGFKHRSTYRLRADYNPEPEVIEKKND